MSEILRLSNMFENGQAIGILEAGQYWHSDRSFDARPDGYAIPQALKVPRDAQGNALAEPCLSARHTLTTYSILRLKGTSINPVLRTA